MRVALYYPWIYLTSGAERTLVELSGRSRHEWTLLTNRFEPEHTFPEFRSRQVVELKRISVKRSIGATVCSALTIARQKLPMEAYDALVVLCEGLGDFAVFRNHNLPILNICLTPLRIAYDPVYQERYDRSHNLLQRLLVRAGAWPFKIATQQAWRYYARVFCISRECLARVREGRLGLAERQEVLHVGIGFSPQSPRDSYERYFLVAGRIMWTKNIELAIQAFQRFVAMSPQFTGFRLKIAGIVDEKSRQYLDSLRALATSDPRIEFHIFPTDQQLAALYEQCYSVLFTPFNEDWGIVPIEAMAFGKPVIAVNRGGPRETVVHGQTGFLEEGTPDAFASRMAELAADPGLARRLGRAGHVHSRQFSWDNFVERIDREIEDLVNGPAPERAVTRARPNAAAVLSGEVQQ